jgi:hypothetical protein
VTTTLPWQTYAVHGGIGHAIARVDFGISHFVGAHSTRRETRRARHWQCDIQKRRYTYPKNDATDVSEVLKRLGFETIIGLDLDKVGMDEKTINFSRAVRDADVALVYYSGHAMQFAGANYLMPMLRSMTRQIYDG